MSSEPRRSLALALATLIEKKAARDGEATVADQVIGEHIGKSRTTVWKLRTGNWTRCPPAAAGRGNPWCARYQRPFG